MEIKAWKEVEQRGSRGNLCRGAENGTGLRGGSTMAGGNGHFLKQGKLLRDWGEILPSASGLTWTKAQRAWGTSSLWNAESLARGAAELHKWTELQNGSDFKAGSVLGWGHWSRCPHDVHSNLNSLWFCDAALEVLLWSWGFVSVFWLSARAAWGQIQSCLNHTEIKQQLKARLRQSFAHKMPTFQWWAPSNTRCAAFRLLQPNCSKWWENSHSVSQQWANEDNQNSTINSSWISTPARLSKNEVLYGLKLITLHVPKFAHFLL